MIDDLFDDYDVYKVEIINDCYMVVLGLFFINYVMCLMVILFFYYLIFIKFCFILIFLGLLNWNKDKYVGEIVIFVLDFLVLMKYKQFIIFGDRRIEFRIGVNFGLYCYKIISIFEK